MLASLTSLRHPGGRMDCLDDNQIIWFLRGELVERRAGQVEAHLDGCEACRELFALLASSSLLPRRGEDAPPEPLADELEAGAEVGRYVIERCIGAGAMGVVYAARDPQLDRSVAVKLLRPTVA